MAAAIITHMMILLQFQQWEDNQKLLEDDSNATSSQIQSALNQN